jgi:hypothetical protein
MSDDERQALIQKEGEKRDERQSRQLLETTLPELGENVSQALPLSHSYTVGKGDGLKRSNTDVLARQSRMSCEYLLT